METFAASHLVVRCDLPGYGEAPVPTGPFSPAAEVLAVLDARGVDRAALVGNSLGGGFALDVCLAAPGRVSALALVGVGRAGWAAREIPGAHRVVMPGVAHIPSLERPEDFDRLVLDFLG